MKRYKFMWFRTLMPLLAVLLYLTSVKAETHVVPRDFLGVELGSADIDAAANALEALGWKPDVDTGDDDDPCLYLFIFGSDKPIRYWNTNWETAMYVTNKENTHIIDGVFLMSSYMTRKEANTLYGKLSTQFRKKYNKSITTDNKDQIMVKEGARFIRVALRESSSNDGKWYVSLWIHGEKGSSPAPTANRKPTSTTTSTSTSTTSGNTLPHSFLGITVGSTKISEAMNILKKKGYSPELKDNKETYISLVPKDDNLKILGQPVLIINFFFSEPKKKTCTDIFCGLVFETGSEAREFIRSARSELIAKYPDNLLVDEQNKLVFKQNGYYMKVERAYLEDSDTWISWVVFANSDPE